MDGLFTNAEAKAYCQSKQSVLLEFDSINEVLFSFLLKKHLHLKGLKIIMNTYIYLDNKIIFKLKA